MYNFVKFIFHNNLKSMLHLLKDTILFPMFPQLLLKKCIFYRKLYKIIYILANKIKTKIKN